MKKKILIIGDSLPHSRIHKNQLIESSWPYLLTEKDDCYVMNVALGGSTTNQALKIINSLSGYYVANRDDVKQFDAVIVQIGVVDCTPRPPKVMSFILKHVEKNIQRRLLRYIPKAPWVSRQKFRKNIEEIQCKALQFSDKVVFISIMRGCGNFVKNVPDVNRYVDKYNKIIESVANKSKIVDVDQSKSHKLILLDDGHHLSSYGHHEVFKRIRTLIFEV